MADRCCGAGARLPLSLPRLPRSTPVIPMGSTPPAPPSAWLVFRSASAICGRTSSSMRSSSDRARCAPAAPWPWSALKMSSSTCEDEAKVTHEPPFLPEVPSAVSTVPSASSALSAHTPVSACAEKRALYEDTKPVLPPIQLRVTGRYANGDRHPNRHSGPPLVPYRVLARPGGLTAHCAAEIFADAGPGRSVSRQRGARAREAGTLAVTSLKTASWATCRGRLRRR
jgi:hypothetical protein